MRPREMAGMGALKFEPVLNGMTLVLLTKLKSKISAQAKLLIETAVCIHSRIRDVRWTEEVFLIPNLIQQAQVVRPGNTREALCEAVIQIKLHAGTFRAYQWGKQMYSGSAKD